MKHLLFFLLVAAARVVAAPYVLPAENQGQWTAGTDVGVVGGIDQYRVGGASARTTLLDVVATYGADPTGVADSSTAIQNAINAATSGQVVYLPTGTYRINTQLTVSHFKDNITLRGAGPGVTTLDIRSGTGILAGVEYNYGFVPQTVTGTKTKGTTALAVASSADYYAGGHILLKVSNELDNTRVTAGAAPTIAFNGRASVRTMTFKVTSVSAGVVNIDPPLPDDFTNYTVSINSQVSGLVDRIEKVGIEDMTITGVNSTVGFGVRFMVGSECWIYNCDIKQITNHAVFFGGDYASGNTAGAYKCEVRKNKIGDRKGAGTNGSGMLCETSTSCLITDNAFYDVYPFWEENYGCLNNVWSYNFCGGDTTKTLVPIAMNHGSHNLLSLYEGNVAWGINSDCYHGSVSHYTLFRNWAHGSNDTGSGAAFYAYDLKLNRFTRKFAVVGNVWGWQGSRAAANNFGASSLSGLGGTGTAQPSLGSFWADWPNANVNGYLEVDLDVEPSTTKVHNWMAAVGAGALQNSTADTLPNSMVYASKPAWFGSLAWPPINPDSPPNSVTVLPAGYRYINGTDPPGVGGGTATATSVTAGTVSVGG